MNCKSTLPVLVFMLNLISEPVSLHILMTLFSFIYWSAFSADRTGFWQLQFKYLKELTKYTCENKNLKTKNSR